MKFLFSSFGLFCLSCIDVPEEQYDHRSLFERLDEQRKKKEYEYEETHKLSKYFVIIIFFVVIVPLSAIHFTEMFSSIYSQYLIFVLLFRRAHNNIPR